MKVWPMIGSGAKMSVCGRKKPSTRKWLITNGCQKFHSFAQIILAIFSRSLNEREG
jgi:hypothetical protein